MITNMFVIKLTPPGLFFAGSKQMKNKSMRVEMTDNPLEAEKFATMADAKKTAALWGFVDKARKWEAIELKHRSEGK